MLKLGVLVSGGGTTLQAVIDAIESGVLEAKIVTVVSSNSSAYALTRAKNHGIDSIVIKNPDALTEHFQDKKTDLIIAAGYLKMLPEELVKNYPNRIMNIHPSLIPAFCGKGYYGLSVHESVIKRGVKVTGATVHFVDERYDEGPIILQKAVPVYDNDTPETLQTRVMVEAERVIYIEAIRLFSENRLTIVDGRVHVRTGE